MQTVSRKLLLAGVLAFGALTAACGDKLTVTQQVPPVGVQTVTVSPTSATVAVGQTIQLSAIVTADAATAKTVTWTSSGTAIATVSATGVVTGVAAGSVTISATSTADATKAAGASVTVTGVTPPPPSTISIASVSDVNGNPVNLSNVTGQINVTANSSGGGTIEVFLAPSANCATNAIAANDVKVASQIANAQSGPVTLSFNTAALTAANAPQFPNATYCIKARLVSAAGVTLATATSTTPLTLNNGNQFKGTISFASATGGPISAVSSLSGLNYSQGSLTVTLSPVVFTSTSPVALISGYLTRNGEVNGAAPPAATAAFLNVAVSTTTGTATIFFTDTTGSAAPAAGNRSIFTYTSLPAGDTLYVTSATDAAGNPISVPGSQFAISTASGVRIDNDAPNNAATVYTVTAPNGYIGAAYAFSSGTSGTAAADNKGGINGVGGVTTTYNVGAAASTAFATLNSCDVTGLTVATTGSSLANTTATNADQAKVVVQDALGNKTCRDVPSTFAGGLFGVDKIAPNTSLTASVLSNGAADQTGYNVSKNWSFIYNDTISGFNPTQPLNGTLTRNFFVAGTSTAADCLIGTYSTTAKTCSAALITVTSNFGVPPAAGGSFEFATYQAPNAGVADQVGYYTVNAVAIDRALNTSTPVVATAAFDNVAPAIGALTQSPSAVASLGTVTVSGTATDNFDLTSSSGKLSYATAAATPFQSVAGTSFGPNFDATMVISGTASVALSNVYRGLQNTTAGTINAGGATPTATVTVTDVGTNTSAPSSATIATTTVKGDILVGNTFTATPTSAAPATRQTSTALTVQVGGLVADPAFQSQPFAQIDIYKRNAASELVLVGNVTSASVTDVGANRTYTYTASGVALTAAATNTFYAVGRNAAGDAVISGAITVTNP